MCRTRPKLSRCDYSDTLHGAAWHGLSGAIECGAYNEDKIAKKKSTSSYIVSLLSCGLDSVLAGGEMDVLLVLLGGLEGRLMLQKTCQSKTDETRTYIRTGVNRLLIARVFFVRRSRGAYFFFL